jgi:glycerol-3-phosphate dehydrogenase (NAD(P)+)
MTSTNAPTGVIGAGAWGTALAQVIASNGTPVRLWAREAEVVESIQNARKNSLYLPGLSLSEAITPTANATDMVGCSAYLLVCPAQHVRTTLIEMPIGAAPLVLCAKGIEARTRLLISQVAAEMTPKAKIAVLSGPTFAHEVAAGKPTAVTLASANLPTALSLAEMLARPHFRPYISTDVIGAEIGGAVKNVLAIACGVVAGMDLGENARAAVIARGFAEMTRFGVARGAKAETLAGLSGLGDLVLTCSSTASRNFSLGLGLGQGKSAADMLADRHTVAEGAYTAPVLQMAAREADVEMPVTDAVCALLDGTMAIDAVAEALLSRPLRAEAL